MAYQRIMRELLTIASISGGSGLLLQLTPPNLTPAQKLFLWGLLSVVVIGVSQWLPKTQPSANHKQVSSPTPWMSFAHQWLPSARVPSLSNAPTQGVPMQEMNRYFAWIEKKLQELVVREGLECGLVRMRRGPQVITLQLRLINPTQRDLQKLMKLGPALAQLLQVEAVRIADTAQGIMVEVPSPKPLTPNGALLARHTRRLQVAIGVDSGARPVWVNLEDHGALFWVGPSRRGKTQSMKSVLYALMRENVGHVQFVIIASPAKVVQDWGVFAGVAGCLGIACTREDIADATTWLVTQMTSAQRYAQPMHTILVVDDLPAVLKAVPQIADDLAEIAGLGAGLGVHLLTGTQGAGSKRTSGGTDIENNVTARILYRPATTRTGSQSAGMAGVALHHLSSAKGDAIALIDGIASRVATAWISDRDIALLPEGKVKRSPWQRAHAQNHSDAERTGSRTSQHHLELPQNQVKPGRTGENQLKPPHTGSTDPLHDDNVSAIMLNGPEPDPKLVLEPSPTAVTGIEAYLINLASLTNEELKNKHLGFDGARFPTPDEQRIIAVAFGVSDSLNKTCLMCYGYKNPKIVGYIKAVIGGAAAEMTKDVEIPKPASVLPDTIDLNTEEGRAVLKRLQEKRLVSWKDLDSVLQEGD